MHVQLDVQAGDWPLSKNTGEAGSKKGMSKKKESGLQSVSGSVL